MQTVKTRIDEVLHRSSQVRKYGMKQFLSIFSLLCLSGVIGANEIIIKVQGAKNDAVIFKISGDRRIKIASVPVIEDEYHIDSQTIDTGMYRLFIDKTTWIDFLSDGNPIELKTKVTDAFNSLIVVTSECNRLYYEFLRLNIIHKRKSQLMQIILQNYPEQDDYFNMTKEKYGIIHSEYYRFVNETSQENPNSFISKYVKSAQLPMIVVDLPAEKHLEYLKNHALDFGDIELLDSDVFTNKTIEYISYYRNPKLAKEKQNVEFKTAVDKILGKQGMHELISRQILEYMIKGFQKYGFDDVIEYVLKKYTKEGDGCIDGDLKNTIERRRNQERYMKIGSMTTNIVLGDSNIDLKKITAEKTLLVFYAVSCPHCKKLLPELDDLYKALEKGQLEVIAISLDQDGEQWNHFIQEGGFEWINVHEPKGWHSKAAADFFVYTKPTMFLLDSDGKIVGKPKKVKELLDLL